MMGKSKRWSTAVVLAMGVTACGASSASGGQQGQAAAPRRDGPVSYAWGTTDGQVVSSDSMRGRATVLLFVTTFDLASQAQAKHLEDLYRTHKPRINAVAVVMEPPKYVPLARSFKEVLELSYPVAIADDATRSGQGPFGVVTSVPSLVVLDRDARPVYSYAGMVSVQELQSRVRSAQR